MNLLQPIPTRELNFQSRLSLETPYRCRWPADNAILPNVWHKVKKALKKSAEHTRLVFVEVNVPEVVENDHRGTWMEAALDQIKEAENYVDRDGGAYPPAYVLVTNHAFHNNLEAADIGIQALSEGYRIPDFGVRAKFGGFKEYLENQRRHAEIFALFNSMKEHNQIPITFDGEIPEFAFGENTINPRLRIGYKYLVYDQNGGEKFQPYWSKPSW